MSLLAYAGGALVRELDEARPSPLDRGVLLGDGIFETIRVTPRRAIRAEAHLDRLWFGGRVTGLVPRETRAEVLALVDQIAARADGELALRVTITRGEGPRGIGPDGFDAPRLTMIARPFEPWPRQVAVEWVRAPRIPAACLDARFKTTSAMAAILARRTISTREGLQRAIDGQVACGLVSNVLLVHGARLSTPHLESGCLPGVTRAALLAAAPSLGLEPIERKTEIEDVESADEVLLSSALMGVVSVSAIDGRARAVGPWAARLEEAIA